MTGLASRRIRSTGPCLEEGVLAAIIDGTLPPDQMDAARDHLAGCERCQTVVGTVTRETRDPTVREVPGDLMDLAAELRRDRKGPIGTGRTGGLWAAAAAMAMAAIIVTTSVPPAEVHLDDTLRAESSTARSIETLRVIAPEAGSALAAGNLIIRWAAVGTSPYYDVRIVTDEGELIAKERVEGTEWRVPAAIRLRPGVDYYVHVDAYPAGARVLGSDHVRFQVRH